MPSNFDFCHLLFAMSLISTLIYISIFFYVFVFNLSVFSPCFLSLKSFIPVMVYRYNPDVPSASCLLDELLEMTGYEVWDSSVEKTIKEFITKCDVGWQASSEMAHCRCGQDETIYFSPPSFPPSRSIACCQAMNCSLFSCPSAMPSYQEPTSCAPKPLQTERK